ncbi:MAG: hypothetical protein ACI81I_000704 [Arcobacteraceae bacterium]|jgi:hypothetical protein
MNFFKENLFLMQDKMDNEEIIRIKNTIMNYTYETQNFKMVEDYIISGELNKDYISKIVKDCNSNGSVINYLIKNDDTILIFSPFTRRPFTYQVDAIYTNTEQRNRGSAKKLLKNLSFFGDLYFDTIEDPLIHLLEDIGAYKEKVLGEKGSTQLILEVNNEESLQYRS